MQSYILLGIAIITTVLSQLLFKKGAVLLGELIFSINNVILILKSIFTNTYLLTGMFFYAISFLLWIFVLSKMKLGVAYPITSLNFVLVIIASYFLFGERLSTFQYAGIFIIIAGVIMLAKS